MSSGKFEVEALGDEDEDEPMSDQRDSIEPIPQMPYEE